jgi:hypothetical protein
MYTVIDAVKADDDQWIRNAALRDAELAARDEQGWTVLDRAAGRGSAAVVAALLAAGADPGAMGEDGRTPADIALAAGHVSVARLLTDGAMTTVEHYCRAYPLRSLRAFTTWTAADATFGDDDLVYVHQDLSVTAGIWHGEDVLLADGPAGWAEFCRAQLGFAVPDDVELAGRAAR